MTKLRKVRLFGRLIEAQRATLDAHGIASFAHFEARFGGFGGFGGFGVWGLGFGFRVLDLGVLGFGVLGSGVLGLGFRAYRV